MEIINNKMIQEDIKEYNDLQSKLSYLENNNKIYYAEIEELKKNKSSTKVFAEYISEVMDSLELGFRLDNVGDDYIIKNRLNNEILNYDDISEGEQNLLALLYFYFELYDDDEQKRFKDNIELIVIDDPISSVDDINKMFVLYLLNDILSLKKPQIFVFTHVWSDFCDLCYGKQDKDDKPFRFLEIKKDDNGSTIEKTDTRISPYKHDFKEIFEFSQKKDASEVEELEIYHYPNLMRKILEEFLAFKAVKHEPTKGNIGSITAVLCGDKPSPEDKRKIGVLLNVCNIFSHKSARSPNEILSSAKFLMEKIKKMDKDHFHAMIQ